MKQLLNTENVKIAWSESFAFVGDAWVDWGGAKYPLSVVGDGCAVVDYTPPPPVVETVPVPDEITMRQARLVLLGAGMLGSIESAIAALPEPVKSAAKIEWEYSQSVKRKNGFVEQLAPLIGLSEKQVDDLFIAGAKL